MKILVTGGFGYVGSTLIPKLLSYGNGVIVLDNISKRADSLLSVLSDDRITVVRGDVRDKAAVNKAMGDCDAVVHLAAVVGFPACRIDPILARGVNIDGTQNVADCAGKRPVVFASTGSCYGSVDGVCVETTPISPLSIYGETKAEAEKIIMDNTLGIGFRFATAFGVSPRMRLDLLINEFVYQAVRQKYLVVYEPDFMRTFIHVQDMASAILFALEHIPEMIGEVYNCGSDKMNYSKRKIAEMIQMATKCEVHYAETGHDADNRNYQVSYDKLNKLGFRTSLTVQEGIRELIKVASLLDVDNPYANV